MVAAALLAIVVLGCQLAALRLRRALWPARDPGTGVLLWQALGLAWGMAAIGTLLAVGLAPYRHGVFVGGLMLASDVLAGVRPLHLTPLHMAAVGAGLGLGVLLVWVLIASLVVVVRARRRHRALLELVGRGDPAVPGALVLDHPAAAAYCLPGVRSRVVVSAGVLDLLDDAELQAVLAHERAHLRARHDLVLIPFTALRRAFPNTRFATEAYSAVGLLIEMCADDHARRDRTARVLATALLRFGAAGPAGAPSGALALTGDEVVTRVNRLLEPGARLPLHQRAATLAATLALVLTPIALMLLPH
ncbi:MAG: M48 family metalloprotease [Streptosporangiales bacterium]|nr:M48 family metalloprotease [Streptosporangiales bacterium]